MANNLSISTKGGITNCNSLLWDYALPLKIVSDSQYVVQVEQALETVTLTDDDELSTLFLKLQRTIRDRQFPLFITHIRSHTKLPGPLVAGNEKIDQLLIGTVEEATAYHKLTHINTKELALKYKLTQNQAKHIVSHCPTCQIINQPNFSAGVNPRGLPPNKL